jgi:hypothetical protein
MARKSNFIGTTETGNLSALGNAQQRDYNFVKSLLNRNDLIKYFAEPSVQENHEKIDWYSETRGKIIGFQDFSKEQVQRAHTELNHLMRELSHLASSAENQVDRQAIENLSVLPDTDSIKMVGDQITIINWAYRLHKRAKGDRQSSNFAGFVGADSEIEEILENNEDAIVEDEITSNDYVQSETLEGSSKSTKSDLTQKTDELEELLPEAEQDVDENATDANLPLFHKVGWILLTLFFLLLILSIILLKDACGVKGLSFLYFC